MDCVFLHVFWDPTLSQVLHWAGMWTQGQMESLICCSAYGIKRVLGLHLSSIYLREPYDICLLTRNPMANPVLDAMGQKLGIGTCNSV